MEHIIGLASCFEEWPMRVWIKDDSLKFVYANKATLATAEMTLDEIRNCTDADLFDSPHSDQASKDEMLLVAGEGAAASTHFELETWKGGKLQCVQTTRTLLRGSDGKVAGILGMTRDLSVVEREEFLRQLAESQRESPDLVVTNLDLKDDDAGVWSQATVDGAAPHLSERFHTIFPGDLFQQRFRNVAREDRRNIVNLLRRARDARPGDQESLDFRYVQVDGPVRANWIRATRQMIRIDSVRCLILLTHRMIPQPSAGELLGATLLSSFPGFIFVKDRDYRFQYVNQTLLRAAKLSFADLQGQDDDAISSDGDEKRQFRIGDDAVIKDGKSYVSIESLTPVDAASPLPLATIKLPIPADIFEPNARYQSAPHVLGISLIMDDSGVWEELRENRMILSRLFSDHTDVIYLKEKAGDEFRYVKVNKAFCRLAGKEADDVIGRTAREVWGDKNSDLVHEMEEQDQTVFRGESFSDELSWRDTVTPDGDVQQRLTGKELLRDEFGKPWRLLGISRNVTQTVRSAKTNDPVLRPRTSQLDKILERRVVLVFCDIRGYSKLATAMSNHPNAFVSFYERFFDLVSSEAQKGRCAFDSLQGDGAMFVFGLFDEEWTEDPSPAERAVQFSQNLSDQFQSLVKKWHREHANEVPHLPELRIGAGIHIGPVMCGLLTNAHRTEFVTLGGCINVAQRIESAAGKGNGDILVSEAVRNLIHPNVPCESVKLHQVKDGSVYAAAVIE